MPSIAASDIARMREKLFFEGDDRARKLSAFWTLLLLAAAIASAGVVSDSTATVIGAMIVAPLMTPIVGIVLAVTIGDGRNLAISAALVLTGALAVIGVGYGFGLLAEVPVDAATELAGGRPREPQPDRPRRSDRHRRGRRVRGRPVGRLGHPSRRRDRHLSRSAARRRRPHARGRRRATKPSARCSSSSRTSSAILVTGVLVMALYRVRTAALESAVRPPLGRRAAVTVIVAFVVVIAVPLAGSTARIVDERLTTASVTDVATAWADGAGWEIVTVTTRPEGVVVRAYGPLPAPDPDELRERLDAEGLAHVGDSTSARPRGSHRARGERRLTVRTDRRTQARKAHGPRRTGARPAHRCRDADGRRPAPGRRRARDRRASSRERATSLDLALYDVRFETDAGALVLAALLAAVQRGVAVRLLYNVAHPGPIPVPPPPETAPEAIEALPVDDTRRSRASPTSCTTSSSFATARRSGRARRTGRTTRGRARRTSSSPSSRARSRTRTRSRSGSSGRAVTSSDSGNVDPRPEDVDGARVRAWFCPEHGEALSHRVAKHIGKARERVRIASPVLTSGPILGNARRGRERGPLRRRRRHRRHAGRPGLRPVEDERRERVEDPAPATGPRRRGVQRQGVDAVVARARCTTSCTRRSSSPTTRPSSAASTSRARASGTPRTCSRSATRAIADRLAAFVDEIRARYPPATPPGELTS